MTNQEIFTARMGRHKAELKSLFLELYHDEKAFTDFCTMLGEYYDARSEALKTMDISREANPNWYRDQDILGMLAYTQCFGQTLKGVQSHLDYLQETGVNYLHLMPPAGKSRRTL